MSFSAKELIKKRRSVRSFDSRPLIESDQKKLEDYINNLTNPFGVPITFRLLDKNKYGLSSPVIVKDNMYLAAKVKRTGNYEIAYGYSFEKACIFALSLGLGTVMLAASLSRKAFESAMDVGPDEVLPVASPVGYPDSKLSVREGLMRKALKADERIPFEKLFFDGTFEKELTEANAGVFAEPLAMARLAPSAANKQPCRAVVDGDKVHFYEMQTMKENALGDVQKVDVGIALAHFDMTMEENGESGEYVFENPGLSTAPDMHYIVTYVRNK